MGNGPDARQVRSALVDYTALGMIDRFLWADVSDSFVIDDARIENIEFTRTAGLNITRGQMSDLFLHDEGKKILLVILDMAGDSRYRDDVLRDLSHEVGQRLRTTSEVVHLFVPNESSSTPLQYGDFQTLILSPEDAATPLSPGAAVNYPAAQHTASTLASATGLWGTSTESPFYDAMSSRQMTGNRGYGRLLRSFHHYRDASKAESELYRQVFDIETRLPHPVLEGERRVLDIGDDDAATTRYADAIMERYGNEFVSSRRPLEGTVSRHVGFFETVKRFFVFFFTNVFGTPRQLLNEAAVAGRRSLAGAAQKMLFGEDSHIEVMLGGQSGKETHSIRQIAQAAEQVNREVYGESLNMAQQQRLSLFWQAYSGAAMTLVDGGRHGVASDEVAGPHIDNTPAIVSSTKRSVPSDDAAFDSENRRLRELVGRNMSESRIQAWDASGAEDYYRNIERASRNTTNKQIHELKDRFMSWAEDSQTTFGWKVGQRVKYKLNEAQEKLTAIRNDAHRVEDELGALPDTEAQRRAMVAKMRVLMGLWFVLMLVLVYLWAAFANPDRYWSVVQWDFFTWQRTLFVGIVISVVILIWQMVIFARAHRVIYEVGEKRRVLTANLGILVKDVQAASNEVQQCAVAYQQFSAWSRILGRALAHPFGKVALDDATSRHPEEGLPRNTVVTVMDFPADQLATQADAMRRGIFGRGWAGQALERHLERGMEVAQAKQVGPDEFHKLYGQPGENSQLAEISRACLDGTEFDNFDHADQLWDDNLAALRTTGDIIDRGSSVGDLRSAMQRIDAGSTGSQSFSTRALTPQGTNAGAGDVDDEVRYAEENRSEESLSEAFTVVEYGRSVSITGFGTDAAQGGYNEPTGISLPTFGQPARPETPAPQGTFNPFSPATENPQTQPPAGFDGLI
ncbi:hypothetical protein CDOO_02720 [Corynebacterium doosanense CAU 212 = DSM 45436]|uniref:Uncharacterized protein n=1 Tax=Corynebacterium doosanense CAU 212 = DSM 45436 TaxID=558173 RepID=A0A097IJ88_9CORY|nr:hypothetical protein CDOO_02720 [Corynebacterium doosanense CAU 212 = DSM 45436]